MDVYWYLSILTILSGAQSKTKSACDSSESVACRDELENLKEYKFRYQFTTDNDSLNEMCRKQHLAVDCVNSFAENCLDEGDQEVYKTLIKGSDMFFEYFCVKNSLLRIRYLRHSECIREITNQLDECSKGYETSQKEFDEQESNTDALKKGTCCLYFSNIQCSANATSASCGESAGELVKEIWQLLGGTYLNQLCQPFSELDTKTCSLAISKAAKTDTGFMAVLFSVFYGTISFVL